MNRILIALSIPLVISAAACSDGNPAGPDHETTHQESPGIVLSNSRVSSTASAIAGAGGSIAASSETGVAYLSAAPQTLPNAVSVEIRNRTTSNAGRLVPIIDGGFDPVQIEARAGEDVELTISSVAGGTTVMTVQVPPRRPPIVVRSNPSKGRVDVALNQVLVVVFSEPIDPSTLNIASLRLLRDSKPVSGTVRLSQNGCEVDFVPDAPLQPLSSYDLVVADILDLDGDAADAYTVNFTTTGDTTPTGVPATVIVSVDESRAATLLEGSGGDTITATVLVKDAAGKEVTSGEIVWYGPSGSTITPTGRRTALFAFGWTGTGTFAATIGGARGTVDITVRRRVEQPFIWTRESGMVAISLPARIASAIPSAINDRGEVVGVMSLTENGQPQAHAFIWSASKGLRDLGTFAGSDNFDANATAINAQGQVVGYNQGRAFRWTEESGMVALSPEPGAYAYGINASGNIVGERPICTRTPDSCSYSPFRWSLASGFESLAFDTVKYKGAMPRAINDAGQIVGWLVIDFVNDVLAGTLWNPDGEQLDIPGPDIPVAINNHGQVAGGVYNRAFRWTRADGSTQFPVSARASDSRAAAINDAGDIVGQMCVDQCRYLRGFLWAQSGAVTDLGLMPGRLETVATGINNNGQVVGYSR